MALDMVEEMSERPKRFVGLHSHDGASVFDGLGSPMDHIAFCEENGLDAWAITNHGHLNSFAMAYLHVQKMRKAGKEFKLIPGCELYVHPDLREWERDREEALQRRQDLKERK